MAFLRKLSAITIIFTLILEMSILGSLCRTEAFAEEEKECYGKLPLTAENAAAIPCRQVLGSYIVRFERTWDG